MFKYTIELKTPNSTEWSPLKSWARPFTDGTTLDDTLDEGCINLSCTTRSEAIPPFSKIRITISEDDSNGDYHQVGQIIRVIGNTKRTRRTYSSSSPTLWDWNIQTLEETKLLERYICDSMTSTNYLTKNYSGGYNAVQGSVIMSSDPGDKPVAKQNVIFTPYQQGTPIEFPSVGGVATLPAGGGNSEVVWTFYWGNGNLEIVSPNNIKVYSGNWDNRHTFTLSEEGTYNIKYVGQYVYEYVVTGGIPVVTRYDVTIQFNIGVFKYITPREDPTITSVCERLLSAGITRRRNVEKQKFILDTTFADKYRDVPAPEFSFTRQTLFEALLTVGGYIHAIPRLNTVIDEQGVEQQVVTFDELGGNDEIDMTKFPKQVYCDKVQNINDFCSTLDSPAQNLLNTQDRVSGAITELGSDYITVRAENAEVIIDSNTAIIRTSLPINQIVKLECGFIDGRSEPVGDITAYVYESAEYDVLSSYGGTAYPYSKGYALRYAQGDNKITNLQTKLINSTSTETAFEEPAIINIIQAVTKQKIGDADIHKLAFRVTYVPIVTSRVLQRKPYGNPGGSNGNAGWDNSLVYNQGGNVVESSFYGEKMKGAIARLGNEVEQRTYDFYHYAQLPKCGQKLDGMYIARVDAEYDITRIRATLTLTKDFNMLSQYVGLNSNVRMYDISEKQSVERFINYSENCYVGDEVVEEDSHWPIMKGLYSMLILTFLKSPYRIQTALIEGEDKDGNRINNSVILPVVSFGFGNSLVFAVSMYDNYGAGFQNSDQFEVNLGNDKKEYKGVQRLVPYTDGLGEIETLMFSMIHGGWNPTAAAQEAGGYARLYPQYIEGSVPGFNLANDPPASADAYLNTGKVWGLIVKKDSREALNVVYQAHFIANRDTIVLGSALTTSNSAVSESLSGKTSLYFLKNKLNMLDKVIDLSEDSATHVGDYNMIGPFGVVFDGSFKVHIGSIINKTNETFKSWAIVEVDDSNPKQGRLFIGENVELVPGQKAPDVYFTIRSNAD